MSVIQLQGITKSYPMGKGQLEVLQGIDLTVEKGEMVAIMGSSGSGKSTLLHLLGLLDRPSSGSYLLDGTEVSRLTPREQATVRGQKIGFIFQTFNLLPYLSAIRNVELGQKYALGPCSRQAALKSLASVGLAERVKHRPGEMSGGEQQRVAVARAVVKTPPIVLADEPTGNLDSHTSKEIMDILSGLSEENAMTLVMVTHDPKVARYCQRIIHIQDGQIINEEKV
jgi:putative ABC transport system ATP-binding protein